MFHIFQKTEPLTVELYETNVSTEQPPLVYQSVINDGLLILENCRYCEADMAREDSREKETGGGGEQLGAYLGVK